MSNEPKTCQDNACPTVESLRALNLKLKNHNVRMLSALRWYSDPDNYVDGDGWCTVELVGTMADEALIDIGVKTK